MTGSRSDPFKHLQGHHSGPRPFVICQALTLEAWKGLLMLISNEMSFCQNNLITGAQSICRLSQSNPHRESTSWGVGPLEWYVLFLHGPISKHLRVSTTSHCIFENIMNIKVSSSRKLKVHSKLIYPFPVAVDYLHPRVVPTPTGPRVVADSPPLVTHRHSLLCCLLDFTLC